MNCKAMRSFRKALSMIAVTRTASLVEVKGSGEVQDRTLRLRPTKHRSESFHYCLEYCARRRIRSEGGYREFIRLVPWVSPSATMPTHHRC